MSFFVGLSLLAHAAVIGSLTAFRNEGESLRAGENARSGLSSLRKALREVNLSTLNSLLTDRDILEAFERGEIPQLDDSLKSREEVEAFKSLLSGAVLKTRDGDRETDDGTESGLFGNVDILENIGKFDLYRVDDPWTGESHFFRLSKERVEKLKALKAKERKEEETLSSSGSETPPVKDKAPKNIPLEYYFRKIPYERILAMGSRLFYVTEGFPEMETEKNPAGKTEAESGPSGTPGEKPVFRVVYIQGIGEGAGDFPDLPANLPSGLTGESIDRILDVLMEFDEDEQVGIFDRAYLRKFDPDNPLLAGLTGEFFYKNLGMVFLLRDELSTGFDFLEQLYYRKRSMNRFLAYARRHPRSRTGEEILFCLAAFLDFERRCIVRLHESKDLVKRVMTDDKLSYIDVHEKKIKAYLLREVAKDLFLESRLSGERSYDGLLKKYRDEQIAVLNKLTSGGWEGRSRALFNMGVLLWEDGLTEEAKKKWLEMEIDYSAPLASRIRGILAEGSTRRHPDRMRLEIDRVLAGSGEPGRQAFLERLIKFHRWAKRSALVH